MNNIINKRQSAITDSLTKAKEAEEAAKAAKESYDNSLREAREKADTIIDEAKEKAQVEYEKKLNAAEAECKMLLRTSEQRIAADKDRAVAEAQSEIASIALSATEKLLHKNIDSETNAQIIKECLQKAGVNSK